MDSRASATVYEALCEAATRFGSHDLLCILPETAQRYGIEARTYSYSAALRETQTRAQLYRAAGCGAGHRVGLMLENRPEYLFHWFALNSLGASAVPIHPAWRSSELEYLIGHAEIAIAVMPEPRVAEMRAAAAAAGSPVVVSCADLEGLRGCSVADPARGEASRSGADAECALLYTSGTTARPKGCVLSNEYFLGMGDWYVGMGGLCALREGEERLITPLPMSHMNAMAASTLGMLRSGGCIVPLDRFHPASFWSNVRESRATIVHYLGVMPAMLLGAPPAANDRDHLVRFGFGAGVSPKLHAAFEARFGVPLIEGWAMTETGAGAVITAHREPRKIGTACFGRPGPGIEWRIVKEDGAPAPPGEPGELWVRAAGARPRRGFFTSYLKDPAATEAAWAHGYFHTGDIVVMDADGDLHFVDRSKNVIRRSGENISAAEVESVLLQHPAVQGVGVTAVPDEVRGDEVLAVVVPRQTLDECASAALARELLEFSRQRLAYFKAPGYVAFCEQLPLTATEKVQRADLKLLGRALIGTPRCVDMRSLKKPGARG